jgi:PLP dependent protein
MKNIRENISKIQKEIADYNCTLVAVTKTKPIPDLIEAYNAGLRHFGENRVQEMQEKFPQLPTDVCWHLIGHLQTNKVKYIAPYVSLIHSVDSLSLLKEINKQAIKNNRIINCLLQVYITNEDSKFGLDKKELIALLQSDEYKELKNISICGLMGMATFTDNQEQIRLEFRNLKILFDEIKAGYFAENSNFKEVSMGMSGDYKIALEEGSTIVRVGSAIFGSR